MSSENSNENATKAAEGLAATLKNNPKALYAAVGAVVVILLAMTMGGRDDGVIKTNVNVPMAVGQTVTVQNPNVGDTWLTAVPRMGAEDTGEEKDQFICLVKPGATATVQEETVVSFIQFVKVTVKDGDCAGQTGWTSKVNVKVN